MSLPTNGTSLIELQRSAKVLIIDDEIVIREMLEALLAENGYQLFFAANGQEGLELAQTMLPDIILLDVLMPVLDGFEVCRRIRSDAKIAEVPIVMLTALHDRDTRLRGLQAGVDDFVAKPFDGLELLTRVDTITRLNRFRRLIGERERVDWMITHANEGFVVLHEDGIIRFANPRACLYLGVHDDHAAGLPFRDTMMRHFHCEPDEAWETWPSALPIGMARYLIRPETADAPACWLQVEIAEFQQAVHYETIVRISDVSDTQQLNRQQMSFHSMIAHKLLTPLNGILPGLQLIAEEATTMSSGDIEQLCHLMLGSAHRLHDDIHTVLRYLDAPIRPPAQEDICTLDTVQTIAQHFREELGMRQVVTMIPPAMQYTPIAITPTAIELVIYELFQNTIKFHPTHTPCVTIHAGEDEKYCLLRITDDGIHLAPEHLMRTWTPYYQGGRWQTGEVDGMGLGLPLVSSIIWNIGGHCRVRNREDGPGISVEMWIPLAAPSHDRRAMAGAISGRLDKL